MDKFEEMLRKQKEFQDKYGFHPELKSCIIAMLMELGELAEASQGKWWSKKNHTHEERLVETVDIWHFFMIYLIQEGITADEFFEAYIKKLDENYRRQESGTY
jgi:hypothetical protein